MTSSALPTGTGLQIMSVTAFGLILFAICSLYYLFTQMDLSRTAEFSNKLELQEDAPDKQKTSSLTDDNDDTPQRRYLTQYRRIVLMLTVAIIAILVYLILVFSSAPSWLEWVGMLIVLVLLGPILQYGDEIRRQRYDRLSLLLTLVLILATGLNLAVYAAQQYADEDIYKGPARIVDYQDDKYNNAQGETVTRTDLMVAWGGPWGCRKYLRVFGCNEKLFLELKTLTLFDCLPPCKPIIPDSIVKRRYPVHCVILQIMETVDASCKTMTEMRPTETMRTQPRQKIMWIKMVTMR